MKLNGLCSRDIESIRQQYGTNKLTQLPVESIWKKLLKGFSDPMIMILLVALVVQLVLFFLGQAEWFEPVGIFAAIIIANGVASFSENGQENKASALRAEEEANERAKVIRDGYLQTIAADDIVSGDIVFLQAGDKLPADGFVIKGSMYVDQSAMNGETEETEKRPLDRDDQRNDCNTDDLLNPNYVYRGTIVCSGEAYMQVSITGDRTMFGKMALELQESQRQTPLQVKLEKLAHQISSFGYAGAIAIIIGVLAKTFITGNLPEGLFPWIRLILDAVTVAVTVIVCAVPEGLPMLTSILLSLQSVGMAKDNVLVRKINGLETAGSISILFSDKTGTMTEGKLSVAELAAGDGSTYTEWSKVPAELMKQIVVGIGANNGAVYSHGEIIGGNSTDRALIGMLSEAKQAEGIDRERIVETSPFDSEKKMSSIIYREANGYETHYFKGAPEKLLDKCTSFIDEDGKTRKLESTQQLQCYLEHQASRSMRMLAVAKENSNGELQLICLLSVRDNVRSEAVQAIAAAKQAGIQVVMVTGDRRETAVAIGREIGLLENSEDIVLSSEDLRALSDDELKNAMPRLRVVSRALPTDKSRLVRVAQEMDHVTGMTGDGVNDAPALRKADVGFAMGSGTEVAKAAGDITILNDNFASICKAVLYGRTMFKSIRKFLLFQLTVNVAAVLTCFIGPLLGENVILTVIQLLLINLAMDTLAAMAYGSEPALEEYMLDKPMPRRESIVTKAMLKQVLVCSLYITVICLGIMFYEPIGQLWGNTDTVYLKSAVFATFMMAIAFNGFNARTEHVNPFENIGRNTSFVAIMLLIFLMQLVFITFGGEALSVKGLSVETWLICGVMAFGVIPVDIIGKLFG